MEEQYSAFDFEQDNIALISRLIKDKFVTDIFINSKSLFLLKPKSDHSPITYLIREPDLLIMYSDIKKTLQLNILSELEFKLTRLKKWIDIEYGQSNRVSIDSYKDKRLATIYELVEAVGSIDNYPQRQVTYMGWLSNPYSVYNSEQ
jgi:hypothetical protein